MGETVRVGVLLGPRGEQLKFQIEFGFGLLAHENIGDSMGRRVESDGDIGLLPDGMQASCGSHLALRLPRASE